MSKRLAPLVQPQQPFDAGAVHPAGCAGIPGPAATPAMRRLGIHIRGQRVRLDHIGVDARPAARALDGIEAIQDLVSGCAVSQHAERDRAPRGSLVVLAAVFAARRQIAPDVAGIERRGVEGGRQQQDADRLSGATDAPRPTPWPGGRAPGSRRARQHAPALRDGIDAALGRRRAAQRRAVVEVSAPIPRAVPPMLFERGAQTVACAQTSAARARPRRGPWRSRRTKAGSRT